ncbi:MAG: hypothetical protein ABSC16_06760 [Candidatus Dormibacteria bacterium]|jgi:hypothetical protein|nr:hypothetical protein [Chloroflexota bacterium]HBV95324.1 hypothetical protein [Chloroflexota bacterium]
MTIIRLVNGSDAAVKLSVEETLEALRVKPGDAGFVELPGEDGPIHLRPSGVIAVFADAHRANAGFRMGISPTGG